MEGRRGGGFSEYLRSGRAFRFDQLTGEEKRHLLNVYSLLLLGTMTIAGGVYAPEVFPFSYLSQGALGGIGAVGSLVGTSAVMAESYNPMRPHKTSLSSIVAFEGTAFSVGLLFSQFVLFAARAYTNLLIQAIVSCVAIFGSLSLAALFAQRRSYMWLGGIGLTIINYTLLLQLFNFFCGSHLVHNAIVWMGTLSSLIFILFDTQRVLDTVGTSSITADALKLLMDFARLFINILDIIMENNTREKRKSRRRD